jgi:hypothetical protein
MAKNVGAKLIHFSAIGSDPNSSIPYVRTKGLAERSVFEICPDATVIRPSIVFGPGDSFFNVWCLPYDMVSLRTALTVMNRGSRNCPDFCHFFRYSVVVKLSFSLFLLGTSLVPLRLLLEMTLSSDRRWLGRSLRQVDPMVSL